MAGELSGLALDLGLDVLLETTMRLSSIAPWRWIHVV